MKPPPSEPMVSFQRPTALRYGGDPRIPDPLERRFVYVAPSAVKDDGLFARRNISRGQVISYYSGLIYDIGIDPMCYDNQSYATM